MPNLATDSVIAEGIFSSEATLACMCLTGFSGESEAACL